MCMFLAHYDCVVEPNFCLKIFQTHFGCPNDKFNMMTYSTVLTQLILAAVLCLLRLLSFVD